jgi:hypothetical protein
MFIVNIQSDSKLLTGFSWPINGNFDNNLESLCRKTASNLDASAKDSSIEFIDKI